MFTHCLGAPPSTADGAELTAEAWNAHVDAFDVSGLVEESRVQAHIAILKAA